MKLYGSYHSEAKELDMIACVNAHLTGVLSNAQMVNCTEIVCVRYFSEPATTAFFDTAVCSR